MGTSKGNEARCAAGHTLESKEIYSRHTSKDLFYPASLEESSIKLNDKLSYLKSVIGLRLFFKFLCFFSPAFESYSIFKIEIKKLVN